MKQLSETVLLKHFATKLGNLSVNPMLSINVLFVNVATFLSCEADFVSKHTSPQTGNTHFSVKPMLSTSVYLVKVQAVKLMYRSIFSPVLDNFLLKPILPIYILLLSDRSLFPETDIVS